MGLPAFHILHLGAIFVLLGYTFYAFAAPAETRKRVLMITGVAALLVILSGFAMLGQMRLGFPMWAIVKLVCLLGIAAVTGMAFRRRQHADALMILVFVLAIVATTMVYLKPF